MKRAVVVPRDPADLVDKVVLYEGRLARIYGVSEGRTVHMWFVEEERCMTCGHRPGADLLTHSRLFQNGVQPAPTLESW